MLPTKMYIAKILPMVPNRKIKINALLRRERHKKEKQKALDKIKNQNGKKGVL